MSILIKGMEMPNRCPCKLVGVGYDMYCAFVSGIPSRVQEYYECCEKGTRPDWCPLIEVPPHGRLIDANAFAAEMKKRQDACAEWCDDIKNGGGYGTELYYRADSFLGAMCETKLTLDKMPTIIPADKDGGT